MPLYFPTAPIHPGYVVGNYYSTYEGAASTNAPGAVDTLYIIPFRVGRTVTISKIALRCTTGVANCTFKAAIFENKPTGTGAARPFTLVAADNTGVAAATTNTSPECSVAATLYPDRTYWMAQKFGAALSTFTSIPGTSYQYSPLIGTSAVIGNIIVGLSKAEAYATSFTSFDGSETWTEFASQIPIPRFKVA